MIHVEPGHYPIGPVMAVVDVEGVARFHYLGRDWAYLLVDGALGTRAEDAMRHSGSMQERRIARAIATVVLGRAMWLAARVAQEAA